MTVVDRPTTVEDPSWLQQTERGDTRLVTPLVDCGQELVVRLMPINTRGRNTEQQRDKSGRRGRVDPGRPRPLLPLGENQGQQGQREKDR